MHFGRLELVQDDEISQECANQLNKRDINYVTFKLIKHNHTVGNNWQRTPKKFMAVTLGLNRSTCIIKFLTWV